MTWDSSTRRTAGGSTSSTTRAPDGRSCWCTAGPRTRTDESTGGDLVATLRGYLVSGAQVRATAEALGVHENTVRYRLGRIAHVTGLDMRRFDALLAAQLAFQVEGLTHREQEHS